MSAFIISVNIKDGERKDYEALSEALINENFNPTHAAGVFEKEFAYYGNLDLLQVTELVKRVCAASGRVISFTVRKNKKAEKPSHKLLHIKI